MLQEATGRKKQEARASGQVIIGAHEIVQKSNADTNRRMGAENNHDRHHSTQKKHAQKCPQTLEKNTKQTIPRGIDYFLNS